MKVTLQLEGMHCVACAFNVDDALSEVAGVKRSKTSYARGRSKIDFDETVTSLEELEVAITQLGYVVRV